MSIAGVSRLLRTNIRWLGVTSKSCSWAGTLPVSGRSECHCIAGTFSSLTSSFGIVPGGGASAVWALACGNAPSAARAATKLRLSIRISSRDLAAKNPIAPKSVAEDKRKHDARSDEQEDERARMRGGFPDGEPVDDDVREEAVREAGKGEHEDRHRAGERLAL